MADSQALVDPYFVRFHATADDGSLKAYPFLVVHEGPSESGDDQKWGWVFCDDENQNANCKPLAVRRSQCGERVLVTDPRQDFYNLRSSRGIPAPVLE